MHKNDFFSLYIFFISLVFTQLPRTPNHFPLPRHWTRDRDFGPATATLDPRPRLWTRDPRPATISQTLKRQTRIFTTWLSFLLYLSFILFIISTVSTHKWVVLRNFSSTGIALSSFHLFMFYFAKFSTWIWRLPFAVYVNLKNSTDSLSHEQLAH